MHSSSLDVSIDFSIGTPTKLYQQRDMQLIQEVWHIITNCSSIEHGEFENQLVPKVSVEYDQIYVSTSKELIYIPQTKNYRKIGKSRTTCINDLKK